MRRVTGALLLAATAIGLLSGCQRVDADSSAVLAAINRTIDTTRSFTYAELAGGHRTVVSGQVADDLDYREAVTVDGVSAAGEVVVDDARALQVSDPRLLASLVAARQQGQSQDLFQVQRPGSSAGPAGTQVTIPQPLSAGAWVLDPQGANQLTAAPEPRYRTGTDPLYDALEVLVYAREAVAGATGQVHRYAPDAIWYRPRYDHLPKPGPGEDRYDVVPLDLPSGSVTSGGSSALSLPSAPFFREMSIYVRGGQVVAVREIISVADRLADPQSGIEQHLKDVGVADRGSLHARAAAYLVALNRALAQAQAQAPQVREREMTAEFDGLGAYTPIQIPAGAVNAGLNGLGGHAQALYEDS